MSSKKIDWGDVELVVIVSVYNVIVPVVLLSWVNVYLATVVGIVGIYTSMKIIKVVKKLKRIYKSFFGA